MLPPTTIRDAFIPRAHTTKKYPGDLSAIPLPVMTRTTSQSSAWSAVSCSSTSELVPHPHDKRRGRMSLSQRLSRISWNWREKQPVSESDPPGLPLKGGGISTGNAGTKHIGVWQGWQFVFFGSWLNVFLLLIPITWILKLATTDSDTLIFTSCMLAMIPLVKLHDLAISVMSRRIGGSKTGLLNASFSNVVELVVAIIALRKCELRVVQSSLVGSILSKLLLILGMCFFAGGMRFSQQDFNTTATQIHSSLLSISVGAVCLPAAFHFALSYNTQDATAIGTTMDQQKADLLKMSHSVSFLLLFIYISYLLFQLWSHTHLYKDSTVPSDKLPVAVSVRSMTERVRQKSNSLRSRRSHSQASSFRSAYSKQTFALTIDDRIAKLKEKERTSPVEEAPETSFSHFGPHAQRAVSGSPDGASARGRTALLLSPSGTASQVRLSAGEFGERADADATVRLVHARERRRSYSSCESLARHSSRSSSFSDDDSPHEGESGRASPVSEVLSAYMTDRGEVVRVDKNEELAVKRERGVDVEVHEVRGRREREEIPRSVSASATQRAASPQEEEEPELSWITILILLTTVTVLVTINSEWLVDSMDSLSPTLSKEWIGLILLPIVSSIAECVTAVNVSVKDQLTLSISVAVGSTIQTALFVIPLMVILGWILDKPLALLFDPFETVVLYISVHIMGNVVADGKSNWLEGVILICLYLVIAVTFWFYPGSSFSSNLAVCVDAIKPN